MKLAVFVALLLMSSASAQDASRATPVMLLIPNEGRTEFHLGERISLKIGYAAQGDNFRVEEYSSTQHISCSPSEGTIDRKRDHGHLSVLWFLSACRGVSAGVLGCLTQYRYKTLGPEPSWYPIFFDHRVQFTRAGTYSCVAEAEAVLRFKERIRTRSNPVQLTIVEDDTWAHDTFSRAAQAIARCSDLRQPECSDAISTITLLDTQESLAYLIRMYRSESGEYPQSQIWQSILWTRHRRFAYRLLLERMQDADFVVTLPFFDTLNAWALREEVPGAFAPSAKRGDFRERARAVTVRHLRLLGRTLPHKSESALPVSAGTYGYLAKFKGCTDRPLLRPGESHRVLAEALVQR